MQRPSIASVLEAERPLVTPLAHDAMSARLIAKAGFKAFAIGGSALLATRYALPDIGLIGVADMTAGIRDIAAATPLPFFADGTHAALATLRRHATGSEAMTPDRAADASRKMLDDALEFARWQAIEEAARTPDALEGGA